MNPTFRPREPGGNWCECGLLVSRHIWTCTRCVQPMRGYWGGLEDKAWMPDATGHERCLEVAPKEPDAGPGYATLLCPPSLQHGGRPKR